MQPYSKGYSALTAYNHKYLFSSAMLNLQNKPK